MTVSECLKEWLGDFTELDFSEMLTDFIAAPEGCFSLFKSPNKNTTNFNDGSQQITEYYQFFARKSSQMDEQRVENQQIIADLEEFINAKDALEDYPDLSKVGNLTCTEICVTNSGTITSQTESDAIYQITISIQYLKER